MSEIPVIPGHTEKLALWDLPATNTAVNNVEYQEYRPVSQITGNSNIEFFVGATGSKYFNLSKTRLKVTLRVVKGDGTALPQDEPVGPINLLHSSIFSGVDVNLQQKSVTKINSPLYAVKAYVDTLLNTSQTAKATSLKPRLWTVDSAGFMDWAPGMGGRPNIGMTERSAYVSESKELTLIGPIYSDFFLNQEKYLLNNVPIHIKLYQSSDSFRLMSSGEDPNYKLVITDCVLQMCEILVNSDVILAHSKALSIAPAHYCFMDADFKQYSIAQGQYSFTIDNMYLGNVPSKMYVFMIPSEAFNGDYKRNPFNFINGSVNSISFMVDGQSVPHITPFKPDFESGNYFESYLSLLENCKLNGRDNGITAREFANGYCIHSFDIDCQNLEDDYFPKPKKGHTRLNVSFAKPLPEAVTLVVYGKFPKSIKIDSTRGVIV